MRNRARASSTNAIRGASGRLGLALFVAICAASVATVDVGSARAATAVVSSFPVSGPEAIAVDASSGDVFVVDRQGGGIGTIKRFDSTGAPRPFAAAQPYVTGHELTGTPFGPFAFDTSGSAIQVAVDGSGGLNDGNIYVAESGAAANAIDVFDAGGTFLGRITQAAGAAFGEACGVAVDPSGRVYVGDFGGAVARYVPVAKPPVNADYDARISGVASPCNIAADATGAVYVSSWRNGPLRKFQASDFGTSNPGATVDAVSTAVAVDPANNDLYVSEKNRIARFSAGGSPLEIFGAAEFGESESRGVAVDENSKIVYAAAFGQEKVLIFGPRPTVDPVTAFDAHSATFTGTAVSNGYDVSYRFEYSKDGVTWTKAPPADATAAGAPGSVVVSQAVAGLVGSQPYHVRLVAGRPEAGGGGAISTETTFTTLPSAPEISGTSVSTVTAGEATLRASVNPENQATAYHFEYTEEADFQLNGYAGAVKVPASDAAVGSGSVFLPVSRALSGLKPGTKYVFRLVAGNATGVTDGPDRAFTTYPAPTFGLPDGRAYELVTPADTNGLVPSGTTELISGAHGVFNNSLASFSGESLVFYTAAGSLPGIDGAGSNDQYQAVRSASGWETLLVGPTGAQSQAPAPGGVSPDHKYSFLGLPNPSDGGSLKAAGTDWLRSPDSSYQLVGKGSLATDPEAKGEWITAGASHVIFTSKVRLEPGVPVSLGGVASSNVYDRTPDGPTRVVSLLPGDQPVSAGSEVRYQGVSADGTGVAFKVGPTLYERRGNSVTVPVASDATVVVGSTLTCTPGPASAATVGFRWLRNGAAVPGALSANYTTVPDDAGKAIQCQVFALNANAGSTQVSNPAAIVGPLPVPNPPTPPLAIATPEQNGSLNGTVTRELTCKAGTWGNAPTGYTYQWYRNGVALGAPTTTASTSSKLTLTAAEQTPAAVFQCVVTAANAGGAVAKASGLRATSPAPSPAAPTATASLGEDFKLTFAGLNEDGSRLFYLQSGNVFVFDADSGDTTQITTGGKATVVNVAADGSHVYFTSPVTLTGAEENERGEKAVAGAANFYAWNGSSTRFIARLDPVDVSGEKIGSALTIHGLGLWTSHVVAPGLGRSFGVAADPSRTTPAGDVLVFESRAPLVGYANEGFSEVYRYDAATGSLTCVSCNPTGAAAVSDAMLEDPSGEFSPSPVGPRGRIANVTDDGKRVFFESGDPLVPGDANGVTDVYEWVAQGTGGCGTSGGCLYLISSGHSSAPSFLYAMTPDGRDVFFQTAEALVPQDRNQGTPAIYDARVGGGFPPPTESPPCQGEGCQGGSPRAPALSEPGSTAAVRSGNVRRHRQKQRRQKQRRQKRKHASKYAVSGHRGANK